MLPSAGRPGFKALLERVVGSRVRVVIVEHASRFARHLLTQEAGMVESHAGPQAR